MSGETFNFTAGEIVSLLAYKNAFVGSTFWGLIGTTGVVLNAIVLIIIYKAKEMHTSGVYSLVNLAITDLMLCLVFAIHGTRNAIYAALEKPLIEKASICFMFGVAPHLLVMGANRMVCLVISAERLAAVIYPMWFRTRGMTSVVIICALPWIAAIERLLANGLNLEDKQWVSFCALDAVVSRSVLRGAYGRTVTMATLYLALVFYVLLLCRIGLKAYQMRNNGQGFSDFKDKIEYRMIRSLGIIVFVYLASSQFTTTLNQYLRGQGYNMFIVLPITKCFWVLNSTINFFIYLVTNSTFRDATMKFFNLRSAQVQPMAANGTSAGVSGNTKTSKSQPVMVKSNLTEPG